MSTKKIRKTKRRNHIGSDSFGLLNLLAEIRKAIGDPCGKLMQDELVARCAELFDRVNRSEAILGELSSGFWNHVLNDNSEGQRIGDQVLDYWCKYNAPKK